MPAYQPYYLSSSSSIRKVTQPSTTKTPAKGAAQPAILPARSPAIRQAATAIPATQKTVAAPAVAAPHYGAAYEEPLKGWSAVASIFNPFDKRPLNLWTPGGRKIGSLGSVGSGALRVGADVALLASTAGIAGAVAGAGGAGAAAGASTGTLGATNALRYGLPFSAGILAGSLLSGGSRQTAAPQEQNQSLRGESRPVQISEQYDYSTRYQSSTQTTTNLIEGSPYASIGGSPSQSATQPASMALYPSQTAPFDLSGGQSASQAQEAGSGWLVPALILGAVLLIGKR